MIERLVRQTRLPSDNTLVDDNRRALPPWLHYMGQLSHLTRLPSKTIDELVAMLATLKDGDEPIINPDGTLNINTPDTAVRLNVFDGETPIEVQAGPDLILTAGQGLAGGVDGTISLPFFSLRNLGGVQTAINCDAGAGVVDLADDVAYAAPIWVDADVSMTQIGPLMIDANTVGAGNRAGGIYRDAGGKPGAAVSYATGVTSIFSANDNALTIPTAALTKGLYWVCFSSLNMRGASGLIRGRTAAFNSLLGMVISGSTLLPITGLARSGTGGDLLQDESASGWAATSSTAFPLLYAI